MFERENGRLWPLVLPLLLMAVVPFMSNLRVGPLNSFYLESGALVFALLLTVCAACTGRLKSRLPRASYYFLALAGFWWLQARLMDLVYPGQSDQAVWAFVILALTLWALAGWAADVGQQKVADVLAGVLLAGVLLQTLVAWAQFGGWAADFAGILSYRGKEIVGQLGQRNHLGHYLMWGVLVAAYLWARRLLPWWAGAAAVVWIAATLGLVNSRTILLYVAAVGVLAVLWRLMVGRDGNRMFVLTLFSLAMVVAVQLGLNTVLGWLGGAPVETALARVENSSFALSARDLEWRKAWQVFLARPLWGHGWGSFSLQGFLAGGYPGGFSPYGNSVLFTHAHNIVLQLLAEMGLAGTLLVMGGALWAVRPFFRRPFASSALLPLMLMTVSLCHSLLEYPLWYLYFLVPFAVMMGSVPQQEGQTAAPRLLQWAVAAAAVVLMAGIFRLGTVYRDLTAFDSRVKNESSAEVSRKIEGLRRIAATEPLLAYYADLALTRRASPADPVLSPWAIEAADRALRYRPYATAYQWGLYRYRLGGRETAQQWLVQIYRYYPNMLSYYAGQIRTSPYFSDLYPELFQACEAYRARNAKAKKCPAPPL
ncbi:PglL family O-oligosaccharyltransferase [Neisseria leonii]|uniref:PglL family O-oligosaccharyltransferase n=1 Tax=Neisseria leonii TaxID=2995413 RepID=UPI00237C22DA|nr:Wzy polymerase domain-containing protein [Neisseria sp. 3986]MDD9326631.1 Wzy polymerase domain-containing protein [Neisseria sp. 3986]